jgi:DNA-binding response OmpR family regulator
VTPQRVLVIEDDADVVAFLRAFLGVEGYEVEVANNGLDGLVKLSSSAPDIALLDVMMPDVHGIRLLEQLLEEGDGTLPVPVIVMTGSPVGAARCRELLDPADVLEKPFSPSSLLERLHAHLGGSDGG